MQRTLRIFIFLVLGFSGFLEGNTGYFEKCASSETESSPAHSDHLDHSHCCFQIFTTAGLSLMSLDRFFGKQVFGFVSYSYQGGDFRKSLFRPPIV